MIGNDWDKILENEYNQEYFSKIKDRVREEYNTKVIFPPANRVFYALSETPYKDTRVVILGQDPYHGVGEANGLCFSVNEGIKMPPSLNNIYKELYQDDISNFLTKNTTKYQTIIAGDVLTYMGDLKPLTRLLAKSISFKTRERGLTNNSSKSSSENCDNCSSSSGLFVNSSYIFFLLDTILDIISTNRS